MSVHTNMELCLLMRNLWLKDELTFLHSYRVTEMAVSFARFLRLHPKDIKLIEMGGLLHDIGKIRIPDEILNKTSKLSEEEYDEIKKHPLHGMDALSGYALGEDVQEMAMSHHERWDGGGYPFGLMKENIPYKARLLALADTLEAITGIRPYRPSLTWKEAYREIEKVRGTQFDPELTDKFLQWMNQHEFPVETNANLLYEKIAAI